MLSPPIQTGWSYERNSGAGVHRRLSVRCGALRALLGTVGAEYLPLPYVPEGLRQLLRTACWRATCRPQMDEGQARNVPQLRACRARLLPRLRHALVLPLCREGPHFGLDRQPRRAGAREAGQPIRHREPAARLFGACRPAGPNDRGINARRVAAEARLAPAPRSRLTSNSLKP